ncbi:hypothetical protein HPP92_018759 [Vanilla planifolia]|uniref:Uncharacterized protein n=1 Tax=Vanilla planifolia TaxID=51239 RepID=A0A835Q7L2_VANPL|nr:hypothetical protein HPP92_018759 [Vanilla planifolia]
MRHRKRVTWVHPSNAVYVWRDSRMEIGSSNYVALTSSTLPAWSHGSVPAAIARIVGRI